MQTEETKKQVAKKQNNLTSQDSKDLVLSEDLAGSWGAEEAGAEDIIIPKILLMHGQSEKVLLGEKSQGEIVRSTDWETLAKRNETIKVIPFKMFKTWRISEIIDGKKATWRAEEPWTADNTDLPWEFIKDGKPYRRDQAYNFYCVLDKDAGTPGAFPMKIQFTRTSRSAGKLLADHFAKSKMYRKPPALMTFEIGNEFINGDENKYFVFTAKKSNDTSLEKLASVKYWFDIISKAGSNVVEHDVDDASVPTNTKTEF